MGRAEVIVISKKVSPREGGVGASKGGGASLMSRYTMCVYL